MTAPVYVNAGTVQGTGNGTSNTPPLPASRTNGNLLIAVITANGSGLAKTFSFGSGWTVIGTPISTTRGNSALAYRYVDGTETAPAITWTGNAEAQGRVYQYSGVVAGGPIGATHNTQVASSTTAVADAGVTVLRNNSRVAVFITGDTGLDTMSTPSGYTLDQTGTGVDATIMVYSQTTPSVTGNASTAVAATAGASRNTWVAWSVEIYSEAAPEADLAASMHGGGTLTCAITHAAFIADSFHGGGTMTAAITRTGHKRPVIICTM